MIIPPGLMPVSSIGLAAGGEVYPPTDTPPQAEVNSTAAGIPPSPPQSPWDMIRSHMRSKSWSQTYITLIGDWRRPKADAISDHAPEPQLYRNEVPL